MNQSEIGKSIYNAVVGDHIGLEKYTDVDSPVMTSFDQVADDILSKLNGYSELFDTKFIDIGDGYIFYAPNMLISFCLHIDSRTRRGLDKLWDSIVSNVGSEFTTVLWEGNARAIRWLQSRGMVIESITKYNNGKLVKLCLH